MYVFISERGGSRTEYEIPGRMTDGGVDWDDGFFPFYIYFFLAGDVQHTPGCDPPLAATHPWPRPTPCRI